jgi:hypothetical protein
LLIAERSASRIISCFHGSDDKYLRGPGCGPAGEQGHGRSPRKRGEPCWQDITSWSRLKIRPRPVRPAQPAETDGPPSRLARVDPVVPLVAIAVPAYYLIPYLAR